VPWIYPGLSIKEVKVFRRFYEDTVTWINHLFGELRIPIFANSLSVTTFYNTMLIHKFQEKILKPKSIRFTSQILKSWHKYSFFTFCDYLVITFIVKRSLKNFYSCVHNFYSNLRRTEMREFQNFIERLIF
jgi:hypothetical protein